MNALTIIRPSTFRLVGIRAFSSVPIANQGQGSTLSNKKFAATKDSSALTWEEFFKLRKQENRINTGSSLFTAFVGTNLSWVYLSTMQIDPTQMIFGFDPLLVICAGLFASGGLGYLFGPLLGSGIFKLKNKQILESYTTKNKDFLKHIKKNRVDASSQSFSNPVPDYYGEKIGSLKEYRQWLKDCQSHRRKAKEFL
ncbi:HHL289Wp [Eremothecium sinecaudum]|uniref:Presequence translocated-associated motor subunit PAM17 n=1 Tax=Eremothecium sinecaudum TaxID=45286 RepID=A0A0X8HVH2_9SACH|nr:HHL289Wp [Eremothecium sinecaudum]AMD22481.1 HHL289Wp [Eremothecium sinecaudum]